jgi:hypothetical protein
MNTPVRQFLALGLTLALIAASAVAADIDPEPPNPAQPEKALPAVDLDRAKKDAKLAQQITRNRNLSKDNLSRIGLATHEYFDRHRKLPADIADNKGKALLSWRVAILPYVKQEKLYKQFKLDEPWDSRHNIKLLAKMPDVFLSPRVKLKSKHNTVYQVFTGKDAVFGRGVALGLAQIPDGTSNTLLAVESSEGVPWTKPGGIPFDRTKAVPDIGKAYGKKPLAVMFDGSPRLLDLSKIKDETLKNAIDPADGKVLGNDWSEGAE